MKNLIKRLFCQHNWKLLRWRWNCVDYDARRIETKCECYRCGEVRCFIVPREEEAMFTKTYPDLEV